jgi:DNA polymerase-3 subunit epsilon
MTRGQETLTIELAVPAAAASWNAGAAALPPIRVLEPLAEELAAHRAYLSELDREARGRCLWLALELALSPVPQAG